MKNIQWHLDSDSRFKYLLAQFSDSKYIENDRIKDLLVAASKLPVVWFDYTDESLERLHFYAWWGCIGRRNGIYSNPTIRDLYLFHEIYHIVYRSSLTIPHDFEEFVSQRIAEEREASFFSEVDIYNLFPSLREKTFKFPILWDEIKNLPIVEQKYERTLCETLGGSTSSRQLVKKYAKDNIAWANIWKNDYYHVEQVWHSFKESHDYGKFVCELSKFSNENIPWRENAIKFKTHLNS